MTHCANLPREVGQIELGFYALQLDPVSIDSLIGASAGSLGCENQAQAIISDWHPADLHIAEEDHAVRSPVLDRVGEDVYVHERAPGLPSPDRPKFAVRMPQTEGRLPGVHAGAE